MLFLTKKGQENLKRWYGKNIVAAHEINDHDKMYDLYEAAEKAIQKSGCFNIPAAYSIDGLVKVFTPASSDVVTERINKQSLNNMFINTLNL
jgi:hypothetical protein